MKKIFNKKFILGIIVGVLISTVTVYAVSYAAKDISFKTSKNSNVKTVQDALDDLYEKKESGDSISVNSSWQYDDEQELIVSKTGKYKLEVWGAQGGNANGSKIGGYGAYSVGTITLNKNDKVYINVGKKGISLDSMSSDYLGGYNGGGNSYHWYNNNVYSSSGGGATHIALKSGVLSSFDTNSDGIGNSSEIEKILIVAGGGGGSYYATTSENANGGSGGGIKGVDGGTNTISTGNGKSGLGGTQTAGGTPGLGGGGTPSSGSFGLGGNSSLSSNRNGGSGGGGGFYGGCGSTVAGAGGGSGYIGNSSLTNKHMTCYNCETSDETATKTISNECHNSTPTVDCAKEGNGYARITYIGN